MSTTAPDTALLPTAVHSLHLQLGARMVAFAGYSLPVQYPLGLVAEHNHTRRAAGWFDISHMGQIEISGPQAAAALESVLPIDAISLVPGQQKYALLLNEAGGILDDLMVLRRAESFWLIVNGACKHSDWLHLQAHLAQTCELKFHQQQSLFALQGPQAVDALSRLVPEVNSLVFMQGGEFNWQGCPLLISRSGYTGEDGFELSVHDTHAQALAQALLDQPEVSAVGLGARNSLRLEAGLPLYGQDMQHHTSPMAAQLHWSIPKIRRLGGARAGGFVGCAPVLAELSGTAPLPHHRSGWLAQERVPVREPAELVDAQGQSLGHVTSGLISPTLDQPVAMAMLNGPPDQSPAHCFAKVRNRLIPMSRTPLPFVPHRYHRG